ncbi:MAG TPA: DNA mismatch repair endonuclease MutL [Acidocella sp.]|jgi:DNA mismatch repair protein MutL|uniref:DNA mismatch repair endonuclease MutL n=1 Tax=Acidocella sp. TaxID=50710 RepID=UPI002C06A796|nr:DNA mismatch repair endonuclease MutL [Acidocella sp.]HVE21602.1 DNA mismatch repair endonuclease MutL [Acidocella sp.]
MLSPTIRRLSALTVNRIAAGEVIERPAAAVKELVENALDAGARRVEVILAGGGIARIEVIDDGCGIAEDQLALAIERHATSKLVDETLVQIATLGFRGEALPSIGAAARLTLISRPAGQDSAYRLSVVGGAVSGVMPAAGPVGTRAIVEDLFFATPARRKFLRSPRAEAEAAERAVWRLALAAPAVAFRLVSDERVLFDVPAQEEAARVAALFGREAAGVMLALDATREGVRLTGLAGPASLSRATTALQSFVVNGRPVLDPVLRMALRLAYRDVIAAGRHPVAALRLEVPAEALDVNVHPAKTELRFADANGVRSLVMGAISRLLDRPVSLGSAPTAPLAPFTPAAPLSSLSRPSGAPGLALRPPSYMPATAAARGFAEAELALVAPPSARQIAAPAPDPAHPLGAPVAQIFDTYLLAVAADGSLVLVDQHAAHERLTEERLRAEFLAGKVAAQPLLLPVVVDFAPLEALRLLAQAETLARLGLEIEAFGPGAVLVRAVPAALKHADAADLLRDLAEEFAESDVPVALEARLDAALARLACHRSIRAGRRLTVEEMSALLREMEATPRAATCSHGRPTFLKLSQAELEKMFGRRGL